jgi:hypothetical protein
MDSSRCFRRSLVARWLSVIGLAAPAAAASLVGCGGGVVVDTSSSGHSSSGGSGGAGGNGGEGANVGGNGGGGGGWASKQCIEAPAGGGSDPSGCPSADEAYLYVNVPPCGWVESGPTVENGQCCYVVSGDECGPAGRPYLVDGRAHTAQARRGSEAGSRSAGRDAAAWTDAGARRPELAGLSAAQRAALAEAWARDGLLEHASVASFGRFALELLSAGAPAALVADAHRAALDEVRHARLCFGLASAYAGETIAPGPFDFGRGVPVDADLARIAARTFLEGCAGETLAAVQAVEQRAVAEDPAVREVLAIVAEDEMRHAELAWRTVAWALRAGGEPVRAALMDALRKVSAGVGDTPVDATLQAHGRLDAATQRASVERTLREVVWPCARALLAAAAPREEAAAPREEAAAPALAEPRHELAAA